ncbi:MAG: hypothetical protein [Circular genetic element sp.]|nr:MAG: hypothetical protein [Circular genetic element sp.]
MMMQQLVETRFTSQQESAAVWSNYHSRTGWRSQYRVPLQTTEVFEWLGIVMNVELLYTLLVLPLLELLRRLRRKRKHAKLVLTVSVTEESTSDSKPSTQEPPLDL